MKVIRVFNNNIVSTVTNDNREAIVQGSGIGFQKKAGDMVDEKKIERIFYIRDENRGKFHDLLDETPIEYFQISEAIMRKVKKEIKSEISDQIIIALTDHIYYAVKRQAEGIFLPNLLIDEIRTLYREEFAIAQWSLGIIEQYTGVRLPNDEAGYIALHIVNAYLNIGTENTANTVIFSHSILDILRDSLHINFDYDSLDFSRFLIHLKFLAQRIFNQEPSTMNEMNDFFQLLIRKNPDLVPCMKKISDFTYENFKYHLSENEEMYLMVHLMKFLQN